MCVYCYFDNSRELVDIHEADGPLGAVGSNWQLTDWSRAEGEAWLKSMLVLGYKHGHYWGI